MKRHHRLAAGATVALATLAVAGVSTFATPSAPVNSSFSVAIVFCFSALSAVRVAYTIAVPPSGITHADPSSPFAFNIAFARICRFTVRNP